uniref:TF-B3 domain-containing protein n=1 Tax=Zea mays TaxID=4577 RepID=A0A804LRA0_MAIZE
MQQEHAQPSMVGAKGCERCRDWQEHYYWEHMDASKIRFFRCMTGDFAHRISVPEKFAKNFKGQITEEFHLKSPSSAETWHVGVEKHGDKLFLVSGWENFAKAHELEENDLLLFACSGNSSFEVLVFGASGCEKVSSLFGSGLGPDMGKQFNDVVRRHGVHHSVTVSDSEDTVAPSQLVRSPRNALPLKEPSGKARPSKYESPNSSNFIVRHVATGKEGTDDEYANSNYYYSLSANRLGDEEKEEIIGLAPIRPNNPVFVTLLRKNHVQRRNNCLVSLFI